MGGQASANGRAGPREDGIAVRSSIDNNRARGVFLSLDLDPFHSVGHAAEAVVSPFPETCSWLLLDGSEASGLGAEKNNRVGDSSSVSPMTFEVSSYNKMVEMKSIVGIYSGTCNERGPSSAYPSNQLVLGMASGPP